MPITTATAEQPRTARSGVSTPAALLAAAANADRRVRLAEAEKLDLAARWADANPVTEENPLAARLQIRGDDVPTHPGLAGVTASAVAELAAQFAVTTHAGTSLVADALELRHRLPRVWDLIMTGQFHLWRARQLAQATTRLNDDAVEWIDRHASIAGLGLGSRQLDELVLRATALHDPDRLPMPQGDRFVRIEPDRLGVSGTANVDGRLSGLDAADLDAALQAEADALRRAGDDTSLDERRAAALGNLARAALGQSVLPADDDVEPDDGHDSDPDGSRPAGPRSRPSRKLSLYAVMSAAALGVGAGCQHCAGTSLAAIPDLGALVTPEVIRDWCGNSDLQVSVTPVIDTSAITFTEAYAPTATQHRQAALQVGSCAFPYCQRPAHPEARRSGQADQLDLDHIHPRSAGGATITGNLAPLCRRHHRLKTFTGWRYVQLSLDGIHLWTSPAGTRYLTTRTTTVNLDDDRLSVDGLARDEPCSEHLETVQRARDRIAFRGEVREGTGPPRDRPPDEGQLDPAPF